MIADLLGRIHPFAVHFPVALVLTAAGVEAAFVRSRDRRHEAAARVMLRVAAWASVPAAITGYVASSGRQFAPELQGAWAIHRLLGSALPMLLFLALAFAGAARRTGQVRDVWTMRALLALAAVLGFVTAWLGGRMGHPVA